MHLERFVGLGPRPREGGDFTPAALASAEAWRRVGPVNDPDEFAAIQPTILVHSPTRLQILCRSRQGVITGAWSEDGGRSWGRMRGTALPNPSAGIDSVRLADGRFLLAYNPTTEGRRKLEIAVSGDGRTWRRAVVLEDSKGEYSYPALIQTRDGRVHVTYTWKRKRIKHVVVDPALIGADEGGSARSRRPVPPPIGGGGRGDQEEGPRGGPALQVPAGGVTASISAFWPSSSGPGDGAPPLPRAPSPRLAGRAACSR